MRPLPEHQRGALQQIGNVQVAHEGAIAVDRELLGHEVLGGLEVHGEFASKSGGEVLSLKTHVLPRESIPPATHAAHAGGLHRGLLVEGIAVLQHIWESLAGPSPTECRLVDVVKENRVEHDRNEYASNVVKEETRKGPLWTQTPLIRYICSERSQPRPAPHTQRIEQTTITDRR